MPSHSIYFQRYQSQKNLIGPFGKESPAFRYKTTITRSALFATPGSFPRKMRRWLTLTFIHLHCYRLQLQVALAQADSKRAALATVSNEDGTSSASGGGGTARLSAELSLLVKILPYFLFRGFFEIVVFCSSFAYLFTAFTRFLSRRRESLVPGLSAYFNRNSMELRDCGSGRHRRCGPPRLCDTACVRDTEADQAPSFLFPREQLRL